MSGVHSTALRLDPAAEGWRLTKMLATGGFIGPVAYVGCWTLAGLIRPGYSPVRQAVSDLGVGSNSWLITLPGVLNWLLLTGFVWAFFRATKGILTPGWRSSSAILLELSPVGFGVASVFSESPATLMIHWMVGANLGLMGPIAAFIFVGLTLRKERRFRSVGNLSLLAGGLTAGLVAATFWAFSPGVTIHIAGVMERVVIIEILGWYALAGLSLSRTDPERVAP